LISSGGFASRYPLIFTTTSYEEMFVPCPDQGI
jgi:hypothetical protein